VNAVEQGWMQYIDGEVRAACDRKRLRSQIRRRDLARALPVRDSPLDHYEWKLTPLDDPEAAVYLEDDWQGVCYLLRFEKDHGVFVFQHDTEACGLIGPHWERTTSTEIAPGYRGYWPDPRERLDPTPYPPLGWLRDHIVELVSRFRPNTFCAT
jgi:hypothetical protein